MFERKYSPRNEGEPARGEIAEMSRSEESQLSHRQSSGGSQRSEGSDGLDSPPSLKGRRHRTLKRSMKTPTPRFGLKPFAVKPLLDRLLMLRWWSEAKRRGSVWGAKAEK